MNQDRQPASPPASPPWQATVITLFPDMFPGPLGTALAGKALAANRWQLDTVNLREFATNKHNRVDDVPYGGGAGMVIMPDVVDAAIESVHDAPGELIYLSPRGKVLDQALVRSYTSAPGVKLLCGRYEGIDQRVLDHHKVTEISVGDYVLSGGELAAMILLDACVRLLPDVMGNADSGQDESFESDLLEYPHYTRPATWQGRAVPDVLLSGHHAQIDAWRTNQAETITQERRTDLWARYQRNRND